MLDRSASEAPNAYFSVATAALLIQVMSVYFFSALLKSAPEWWPDGTAVYFALHLDHLATPFAVWFRQFSPVLSGLTYYVWVLELIGPILMFLPVGFPWLRLALQAMFITMHIGFFLSIEIGLFPFISITSLLAFTPGVVWDWLQRRVRTPPRAGLRIYYDGDCEFCRKVCLILRTMLLLPAVPIREAQGDAEIHAEMQVHNSWVVVDYDGTRHVRWQALALVFRRSPLFAPLGALMTAPGLAHFGDRVYEVVARNRSDFGRLTAVWLPYREVPLHPSSAANLAVGALALVVLWINVASLPAFARSLPRTVRDIQSTLVLAQKWNMFAPSPGVSDGWYVVRGVTHDGTVVDVLKRTKGEPDFFGPTGSRANTRPTAGASISTGSRIRSRKRIVRCMRSTYAACGIGRTRLVGDSLACSCTSTTSGSNRTTSRGAVSGSCCMSMPARPTRRPRPKGLSMRSERAMQIRGFRRGPPAASWLA